MLYTIDLQGMEFHAFHGCYDLEQRVGNRFEVTLSITTELGGIAAHDAVEEAVNYLTVYEIVRERMAVTQRTIEDSPALNMQKRLFVLPTENARLRSDMMREWQNAAFTRFQVQLSPHVRTQGSSD